MIEYDDVVETIDLFLVDLIKEKEKKDNVVYLDQRLNLDQRLTRTNSERINIII